MVTLLSTVESHFHTVIGICVVSSLLFPLVLYADETYTLETTFEHSAVSFDNQNWFTSFHPLIAQFTVLSNGNSFGTTTTGAKFSQYSVPNDVGIKVQRFEIQDHFHYIVEGRIVNTLETLSAQLALAHKGLLKTE